MIKTIYSAKPHKDGYKITRYKWNGNQYKEIKGVAITPNKDTAIDFINGIKATAEQDGFKTKTEQTQKWYFLTIEGDFNKWLIKKETPIYK